MVEWGWEILTHEKMKEVKDKMLSLLLKGHTISEVGEILMDEYYIEDWALYCLAYVLITERGQIFEELKDVVSTRLLKTLETISDEFDEDDEDNYDPIVFIELHEKVQGAEVV